MTEQDDRDDFDATLEHDLSDLINQGLLTNEFELTETGSKIRMYQLEQKQYHAERIYDPEKERRNLALTLKLEEEITRLNLEIPINPNPYLLSTEAFESKHILGIAGINDITVAIAAGAKPFKLPSGEIIQTVLLPVLQDGISLLRDEKTGKLYSSTFWFKEENVFTLVDTDKPIQLDAVLTSFDTPRDYSGSERFVDSQSNLQLLTENKQLTKDVLLRNGFNVPDGIYLKSNELDTYNVADIVANLGNCMDISDGFVIKANDGSCGSFVKLFTPEQNELAPFYTTYYLADEHDVIIEKRIIPQYLKIPRPYQYAYDEESLDWNVRVITTIDSESSNVVDAEIRFSKKGEPVNISLGAEARRLDILPAALRNKIFRTATEATQVLCKQAGIEFPSAGIAGIDLMVSKDGKIYILEANAGRVGGLSTLTRHDMQPLESVNRIIEASIPKLYENKNYSDEPDQIEPQLSHFPINDYDGFQILIHTIRIKSCNEEEIMSFLENKKIVKTELLNEIAKTYLSLDDLENALVFLEKSLKIDSADLLAKAYKMIILRRMGKMEEYEKMVDTLHPHLYENELVLNEVAINYLLHGNEEDAREIINIYYIKSNYRLDSIEIMTDLLLLKYYELLENKEKYDEILTDLKKMNYDCIDKMERSRAVLEN